MNVKLVLGVTKGITTQTPSGLHATKSTDCSLSLVTCLTSYEAGESGEFLLCFQGGMSMLAALASLLAGLAFVALVTTSFLIFKQQGERHYKAYHTG